MMTINSSAHTDPGRRRDHNEDAFWTPGPDWPSAEDARHKGRLYVVADGMGGHQAGEVAAGIATDVIPNRYYADPSVDRAAALLHAIEAANAEVFRAAQERPDQEKMGTTVVAVVVHQDRLIIAHAGDSRAYLVRDGRLQRLTKDHSWVEERRQAGDLTAEEAASHPLRNVVTRSLGHDGEIEPTVRIGSLEPGDRLLLCSDGLWEPVEERTIAGILANQLPARATRSLIEAANEVGGPDNIAAVVVHIEGQGRRWMPVLLAVAGGGAGLLLIGLLCASLGRMVFPNLRSTPMPTSTPPPTPTPPNTSLEPGLIDRPIPYQGVEEGSVMELGERFGYGALIDQFGYEQVLMRGIVQGRPLTATTSITLTPRPPVGTIIVGEIPAANQRISSTFPLRTWDTGYTVTLSQSVPITDPVLIDGDRLWGRVVGLIGEDRRTIYALTLQLGPDGETSWDRPVYDRVPGAGWRGWFYFRIQPEVMGSYGALTDMDCGTQFVAAYLSLEPGGALAENAFYRCLEPEY
jgi:protein phosphatase